jgi:3-oxoacyl-[acyl-carrier-protein] synthase III
MTQPVTIDPCIRAIAAEVPEPHWSTEELLSAAGDRLSPQLIDMMRDLGVDNRHSILANYPAVLFEGAAPELSVPATGLAAAAVRRCIAKAGIPAESIGLVLGATSSPGRLLPSLVCDLFAELPELPRSAENLSVSYMGCSVIARVVQAARWYLTCHPGQVVLACFMDAITPLSPPLPGKYGHFSEVPPDHRQETVNAMHGFLFGDAAVAMVLGADGDGPAFGPVAGLTNELPADAELGTVPDGGSDVPEVFGRRLYTLSPDVSRRGVHYASQTVRTLVADQQTSFSAPSQASMLLMHTGSKRILHGLCDEFQVPRDSEKVASSYRILRDYGNTIGCSIPLMLAEEVHRPEGEGIMMAFGLSFACGSCSMRIPAGGWTP